MGLSRVPDEIGILKCPPSRSEKYKMNAIMIVAQHEGVAACDSPAGGAASHPARV